MKKLIFIYISLLLFLTIFNAGCLENSNIRRIVLNNISFENKVFSKQELKTVLLCINTYNNSVFSVEKHKNTKKIVYYIEYKNKQELDKIKEKIESCGWEVYKNDKQLKAWKNGVTISLSTDKRKDINILTITLLKNEKQ